AAVPSLFHSSDPSAEVHAMKKRRPFALVRPRMGFTGPPGGTMFLTIVVPASVPSLFHNCGPLPSSAEKYTVWPIAVRSCGWPSPAPLLMSLTRDTCCAEAVAAVATIAAHTAIVRRRVSRERIDAPCLDLERAWNLAKLGWHQCDRRRPKGRHMSGFWTDSVPVLSTRPFQIANKKRR